MQFERLVCDISFGEKVRIFSLDYLKCCKYIAHFDSPKYLFTKKLFSALIGSSQVLEDFLDFHGAKNNSDWYFYRELAAAVRHLSLGGYCQTHISNRLIFYDLKDNDTFEAHGTKALHFLRSALIHLAPVILAEAQRLRIPIPDDDYSMADFPGVTTSEQLAYDIYDTNKDLQKKNIIKIASELLHIASNFDALGLFEPVGIEEIRRMVPDRINEVEIRRFEMLVHNLQSSFDTYVIHGGYRFGDRKLKALRGHFSVVFHLLQMIGRLLHFYERHLHEAGYKSIYKQVQDRLASLVNPEQLLDCTINYGLYWVCFYLNNGRRLAQEIMNENIERSRIEVGIPQKLGFHSRPSLLVAKIVQHYGGQVEMVVGQDRFDASSVLDLQWAGGKINKEGVARVHFEGDVRALADIEILASVNYGEDSMGKGIPLPKALDYLR
ncbi:MAG: HPr family phosphocarrier protein [Desulfobacteraceae bacterium]|jgi:phosphotransferase system HPr-like phosphotransfer protein|nr:HPr family phosphocarrier protein [Desulfobacteraceae bacterium]